MFELNVNIQCFHFLIFLVSGYPLALIHRKFIYGKPPSAHHLFSILSGLLLGYWNYGLDIFHTVFAISLTYSALFILGGTTLSVAIIFIFNLSYLLLGNTQFYKH